MARRKPANANGGAKSPGPADVDTAQATNPPLTTGGRDTSRMDILAASAAITEREPIKVNNLNAVDLKNACDDAVKRLLSQPNLFQEKHTHTDVKLLLGWASVIIAVGTAVYGWKVDFEQSKPVVWIGVILYTILTSASTLYSYFIEKDTVFVGRRRTLAKRVETEHITVASRTLPPSTPGTSPRYRASVAYVRASSLMKKVQWIKGGLNDGSVRLVLSLHSFVQLDYLVMQSPSSLTSRLLLYLLQPRFTFLVPCSVAVEIK